MSFSYYHHKSSPSWLLKGSIKDHSRTSGRAVLTVKDLSARVRYYYHKALSCLLSMTFVFHCVSFLSCDCFSVGKLSSFSVYYLELTYCLTRPTLSLKILLYTNTETNEVIHGVFRAFRRFVQRSAGRFMRSIHAN